MAYNNILNQTFQSEFSLHDWETQLAIFKAMFNSDDILVNYLDDENEEVKINSQDDLDYAYQLIEYSNGANSIIKLILRNSRNEIIAKLKVKIDPKAIKSPLSKSSKTQKTGKEASLINKEDINTSFSQLSDELNKALPTIVQNFQHSNSNSGEDKKTDAELKKDLESFVNSHLVKFKENLFSEIDSRINRMIESNLSQKLADSNNLLASVYLENFDADDDLEMKVEKLFGMIIEARASGRSIKCALLEEELQSTGAFWAEFIKDCNMPDGTKCLPNTRFQKVWQIKNTGKLNWNKKFPIKVICVSGTILNNASFVTVADTKVNEITSISVDLIAPKYSGNFYSEWVLSCNGFHFGPRIWCSIQVVNDLNAVSMVASTINNSISTPLNQTSKLIESLTVQDANDNNANVNVNNNNPDMNASSSASSCKLPSTQSEFEMNINRASSTVDDFDDEFVVVPDCFDLSKKWTPMSKSEYLKLDDAAKACLINNYYENKYDDRSNEENLAISRSSSHSVLNQTAEEAELVMLNSTETLTIVNKNDFQNTNNDTTNSPTQLTSEIKSDSVSLIKLVPAAKLNVKNENAMANDDETSAKVKVEEEIPTQKLVDSEQVSDNSAQNAENELSENRIIKKIDLTKVISDYEMRVEEAKNSSNTNNNTIRAFDLMKNAFSNFSRQAQSYSPRIDIDKAGLDQDLSTLKSLVDKLVSMGFANRQANERLLKKYNNNINEVIQHLVDRSDNNWSENR